MHQPERGDDRFTAFDHSNGIRTGKYPACMVRYYGEA